MLFNDKNSIVTACCFAGTLLSLLIDGSLTSSEKIFLKSKSLGSLREVIEITLCQKTVMLPIETLTWKKGYLLSH